MTPLQMDASGALCFFTGMHSAHLALLEVVPETAEVWDAPSGRMVRLFVNAASVVAGEPIGLGDHDTLTPLWQHNSDFAQR
jgi:hypothetical protein